jgi:hypothetical protein
VESPELRTLFAVYASMALGTSESATADPS